MRIKSTRILSIILCVVIVIVAIALSGSANPNKNKNMEHAGSTLDIDWWPMFGHDLEHSHYSTSKAPNYSKYSPVSLVKEININQGEAVESSLIVTSEGIFIESTKCVYAYDHYENLLWNKSLQGPHTAYSTPAISNGKIYYSDAYQVYCRDIENGNLIWNYNEPDIMFSSSSPIINNGKLWTGSFGLNITNTYNSPYPNLYAFNLNTGTILSKLEYPEHVSTSLKSIFTPAISDGVVYVMTLDDDVQRALVLAVDESDGTTILWNYTITNGSSQHNTPAIHGDKLFVCVQNNVRDDGQVSYVLAINKFDGSFLWRFNLTKDDINEWAKWSDRATPAIYAGKVIVPTTDWINDYSTIYALNESDGTLIWEYNIPGEYIWGSASIADDLVFVGTESSNVYAINVNNGTLIWNYTVSGPNGIDSTPSIANGNIYIGGNDAKVYIFESLESLPLESTINIDPDTLNFGSKGKWITCYIELPKGYYVKDIDTETILLEDSISPILDPKYGFVKSEDSYIRDHDSDGILERMVKFYRAEVMETLEPGLYNLKITGELNDGT
ncbi:MAG: PQQ-binding-like beta-propeller repeat protein, partial [Thermoplasmata archaeon]|nr:PQQ-binding-like beta-propeller repeat protein [Thermoplasmata archaeon]